jgi:hypothetical protein
VATPTSGKERKKLPDIKIEKLLNKDKLPDIKTKRFSK